MKKTILLSLIMFPFLVNADCTIEKRSIQELLYEDKQDLINSYCQNHSSYLIQYKYAMGSLRLGIMDADYEEAVRKYKQCSVLSGGENNLITKVLKKDHNHEINLKKDCEAYLDLYKSIEGS